jgi:Carboxypeptidase regulatory-like domain
MDKIQTFSIVGCMMAVIFGSVGFAASNSDSATRFLNIHINKPEGSALTNGTCYIGWDTFDKVGRSKIVQTALSDRIIPVSDNIEKIRIELKPKADAPFYGRWTIKPREMPAEELENGITLVAKRCASIAGKVIDEAGNAVPNIGVKLMFSTADGSLLGDSKAVSNIRTKVTRYEDDDQRFDDDVLTDPQGLFRFGLIPTTNTVEVYLWDNNMEGPVYKVLPARQNGPVIIQAKKIYQQDVTVSLWTQDENKKLTPFTNYTGRAYSSGDHGMWEGEVVNGISKKPRTRYGKFEFCLPDAKDIVILNPEITIPDDGPDVRLIVKAPTKVKFSVRDKVSGKPVAGAGVTLRIAASGESLYANTDERGEVLFAVVDPQSKMNVTASRAGYLPYGQNNFRLDGENQIQLDPGLQLYGTVTSADGLPVTNAMVALMRKDSGTRSGGTGDKGQYGFGALEPGLLQIVVFAKGFSRKVETVTLNQQASPHNITIDPGLQINISIEQTLRTELIKLDPVGQLITVIKGTYEMVSGNSIKDVQATGWVSPGAYDIYWVNSGFDKAVKIHSTEIRTSGRITCPQKTLADCKQLPTPISFTIGGMTLQ